jgi:hypothetical protein
MSAHLETIKQSPETQAIDLLRQLLQQAPPRGTRAQLAARPYGAPAPRRSRDHG